MKSFIRHLLTGIDNHTYDLARVLWLLGGLQFLALAGWAVIVNKHPFDPVAFGTGLGIVLTAGGIAVAVKQGTEPCPKGG